jgi:DNA-directed RNA polymerase specialized sigma24 family protein
VFRRGDGQSLRRKERFQRLGRIAEQALLNRAAISAIIFQPGRREARRDLWLQERRENKLRTLLDAVTQLKSTERFVFVMTVLEGYSVKETALLLDRAPEFVQNLRIEALQQLAEHNPEMIVTVHPQESRLTPILLTCNPTSGFQDV